MSLTHETWHTYAKTYSVCGGMGCLDRLLIAKAASVREHRVVQARYGAQ